MSVNPKRGVIIVIILALLFITGKYVLTGQFTNTKSLQKIDLNAVAEALQDEESQKSKGIKRIEKLESQPPVSTGKLEEVEVKQHEKWFPSEWGADDRRGAANRLTPQKVLQAASLIKTGEVFQLGRVYESGIPVFGTRHYSLRIPAMSGPLGDNKTTWFEEIFSGEIGQIGTQFDGLGHIGIGDHFYNGLDQHDFAKAEGLTELGVENVGPIVTRGVLIDVAGFKGVDVLSDKYEITRADLEGALKKQDVAITPGDVVVIHTGWGKYWMTDNDRYSATEPGIGLEAAEYLVEQKIVMTCCDN